MQEGRGAVAYLVSRFPAITETFVLDEVAELRGRGLRVDVFPLFGARGGEVHAAWPALRSCTHFHRTISWELAAAQLHWLRRRPVAYLRAWGRALARSASSRKLVVRAPLVIAKAALLARRLEAMGARHVHAHWATHPALAAWFVRELTGIGYSFTAHAHDLYVDRAMLREKIAGARFVVTISEFNRAFIEERCGAAAAGKVHVVRCGVDPALFSATPRRRPLVPTFVCVASLRPYKGHDVLLDACNALRARGDAFRIVLVGDGELRAHLRRRVTREGLAEVVALRGGLPHEEVPRVLAEATALVLPSVRARDGQMEGIPVALMEAMSAGVPVVASRLSGIPELVEDGISGLLVPAGDAEALAAAMHRLALDPTLAEGLAEGGRRAVRERFDRSRNLDALEALLAPWARGERGRTPPRASAGAIAEPAVP